MHRAESDGLSALAFNFCFLFLRENLNLHWLLLDDDWRDCFWILFVLFLRENFNLHSLPLMMIKTNASRRE